MPRRLIALLGLLVSVAAIAAFATVGSTPAPPGGPGAATKVATFDGLSVWSVRDEDGAYRLVADAGSDGDPRAVDVAPRGVAFDVDLGPGPDGSPVAVYSRCEREPRSSPATAPLPAYATGGGCDLFAYDFARGAERRVPAAGGPGSSRFLPSIWREEIAFAQVDRAGSGLPDLYVRQLGEGEPARRQAGGPRGGDGLPGPTSLDLYGRRLAFGWSWSEDGRGRSEVRLDAVDGDGLLIDSVAWRSSVARYVGPSISRGRVYYGARRTVQRDGALRSLSSSLHRYRISDRAMARADAPAFLVSTARSEQVTVLATAGEDGDSQAVRVLSGGEDQPRFEPTTAQLPGGGRSILPEHRVVALYGHPGVDALGILGIGSPQRAAGRLDDIAGDYGGPGLRPVMPAFELITPLVLASPGEDGMYRKRLDDAVIARYHQAAREADALLILDIQPGRADFMDEARALERWLKEPDVSLALDPEWHMGPGEVPGKTIGSVDAATVNEVSQYLSDLVRREHLPQKLLLLHRFTDAMIDGEDQLRTRPGLAIVENVDGFGTPPAKIDKYDRFTDRRDGLFQGFKLFFEEDTDLMSPNDVLGLRPRVDVVIYE
jgi:hypothetical protein